MIAALKRCGMAFIMVFTMVAATLSVSSAAHAKPASPNGSYGYCHFYRGHVHCHGVKRCKYIKFRGTWYWSCKKKHVRGDIRIGRGTRVVHQGYPGIRTVPGFNPGRGFRPNNFGHLGFRPGSGGFGGRGPIMHGGMGSGGFGGRGPTMGSGGLGNGAGHGPGGMQTPP